MNKNIAIKAQGLGKRYRRGSIKRHNSLRDSIEHSVASMFRRQNDAENARDLFWALKDASFEIARGENVGIIGLNGAGKSTLLKVLSRIVTPSEGDASVYGRLGALLEVGTGFQRELTGRENVYLYGSILGMSRTEINGKFDDIVEFSEIADFIDTTVKHYSSGMYVRLAFAVAAHLDPEILLLDEVLAVGDFAFQRKCMEFSRQLEKKGATILFVSHNMFSIRAMCPRVIYLRQGRIVYDGPTDEGLNLYESDSRLAPTPWFSDSKETGVIITDVELLGEGGERRTIFDFGERMRVRISYRALRPIVGPHFLCSIKRADDLLCCNYSSYSDKLDLPSISGSGVIELLTPPLKVVSDRYMVTIAVREKVFDKVVAGQIGGSFHVRHEIFVDKEYGVFHEPAQWRLGEPVRSHSEPEQALS
jgi:lipopolysaccharide transport system ATP-binding protein